MRPAVVALLLLAGCRDAGQTPRADTPGARLERAARATGLVPDPARGTLLGSWSRDTDRMCIVPGDGRDYRIGAIVDYGEGQSCSASGTAAWRGDVVDIRFGKCRIAARYDGDRITFPAELSSDCTRTCAGRATFAAMAVERVSESVAEASTLRRGNGEPLCAT